MIGYPIMYGDELNIEESARRCSEFCKGFVFAVGTY